jgi:hypothetical protein
MPRHLLAAIMAMLFALATAGTAAASGQWTPSSDQATQQTQTADQGQANIGEQTQVPIASPAVQVNAVQGNQILTAFSRNGDTENNNQSQDLEQSNDAVAVQSQRSGDEDGSDSKTQSSCDPCGGHDSGADQSQSASQEQANVGEQKQVPILSPAVQVNAVQGNQVATFGSENGDIENNNQSQEFEQSNDAVAVQSQRSGGSDKNTGSEKKSYGDSTNRCGCDNASKHESSAGQSQRASQRQANVGEQKQVPILSPAVQVNAVQGNQVLTLGSENGDIENNNQSQEFEQSNDAVAVQSQRSGGSDNNAGSDKKGYGRSGDGCGCDKAANREGSAGQSQRASQRQANVGEQKQVPILSPAVQVNAVQGNQVLTFGSENGDIENNNQSQEFEQSNEAVLVQSQRSGGGKDFGGRPRSKTHSCGCDHGSGGRPDGKSHGSGAAQSQRASQGQVNYGRQTQVPILSPAVQVNALQGNQVLTAFSRNGDIENNNQSQEFEQSNEAVLVQSQRSAEEQHGPPAPAVW